ncbi:MAG: hypothetical protein GYB19_10280 [Rhodospirillales bacterium]|nr:hypothetical protein [Rhodospirillales bacterium]
MPQTKELPLFVGTSRTGDFRRQAFRPSKWREYREREREKNRASMKAMGLSSNVFEWPSKYMPNWARAREPYKAQRLVDWALNGQGDLPSHTPSRLK